MDYSRLVECIALGGLGALAGEFFKLYEMFGKLSEAKFSRLVRSAKTWTVIGLLFFFSGFVSWAVNAETAGTTTLQVVLSGMGAAGLSRRFLEGKAANSPPTAGPEDTQAVRWRDLFR